MRFVAAIFFILATVASAFAQTNLTTANAPSYPIIQPSSGNLTGAGCDPANQHVLWWVDQNICSYANSYIFISKDPSALLTIAVSGTPTPGKVTTLNFIFNGSTVPVTYTTQVGDTTTSIAAQLVTLIQANPALFTAPIGGLPGQILFITSSLDGGLTFGPAIALDFNSTFNMKLSQAPGGETMIYDPACGTTGCTPALDNNPGFSCGKMPDGGGVPPPLLGVICNWTAIGSQSNSPAQFTVQYSNWGTQVQSSVTGALLSRLFFTVPDQNGALNQGIYIGRGATYPVADNMMWSGHSGFRWSTVWGYIGDFATGLTVASKPGLSKTVTVAKSMFASCTMTFTGGILTGGTC